jgi:23S rRNA pseudouridine2605 synthase
MQYVQTRFENLARRISLSGICSRRLAEEAIAQGCVEVDYQRVSRNFSVPDTADVRVHQDDQVFFAPPPGLLPRLWALGKPRGVATQSSPMNPEGNLAGLRDLLGKWDERNKERYGQRWVDTAHLPNQFLTINHVPVMEHGLVLLTTDGEFAEKLRDPASSILTSLKVKVSGSLSSLADKDPEAQFRAWRTGVRAGGVDFGRVFVRVMKRAADGAAWLKIELVATRERDVSMLLYNNARLRVVRTTVEAFGPYTMSAFPPGQITVVPFAPELHHLVSQRELRSVLLSTQLIDPASGNMRKVVSS